MAAVNPVVRTPVIMPNQDESRVWESDQGWASWREQIAKRQPKESEADRLLAERVKAAFKRSRKPFLKERKTEGMYVFNLLMDDGTIQVLNNRDVVKLQKTGGKQTGARAVRITKRMKKFLLSAALTSLSTGNIDAGQELGRAVYTNIITYNKAMTEVGLARVAFAGFDDRLYATDPSAYIPLQNFVTADSSLIETFRIDNRARPLAVRLSDKFGEAYWDPAMGLFVYPERSSAPLYKDMRGGWWGATFSEEAQLRFVSGVTEIEDAERNALRGKTQAQVGSSSAQKKRSVAQRNQRIAAAVNRARTTIVPELEYKFSQALALEGGGVQRVFLDTDFMSMIAVMTNGTSVVVDVSLRLNTSPEKTQAILDRTDLISVPTWIYIVWRDSSLTIQEVLFFVQQELQPEDAVAVPDVSFDASFNDSLPLFSSDDDDDDNDNGDGPSSPSSNDGATGTPIMTAL